MTDDKDLDERARAYAVKVGHEEWEDEVVEHHKHRHAFTAGALSERSRIEDAVMNLYPSEEFSIDAVLRIIVGGK